MANNSADKSKITYLHGDQTLLDEVRGLWEELNRYHCERSEHFKEHYLGMTWQKRKYTLKKHALGGVLSVEVAVDKSTGQKVAYVISTVDKDGTGEVESIYVAVAYRRLGIGDQLMRKTLDWMNQNGATAKQVEVSVGNEVTWDFYCRYGFLPRKTLLKQVKK
ncbi:MAG: GNAT family N-acetyltransferase [Candidatus Bathyarchaeia archaeon]